MVGLQGAKLPAAARPHRVAASREGGAACAVAAHPGLHAGLVWQADALHTGEARVQLSGHTALDAELPGGGWPLGGLIELLQPAAGEAPVWPLLLPALVRQQRVGGGAVVLVNPPHMPYLPAQVAAGLCPGGTLWLRGETPAAQLWSTEQALRCADVSAVLAWLPRVRQADLRRLQLAAAQRGDGVLLFALRPASAAQQASPAPLRLRLELAASESGLAAADAAALQLHIVKRRGPPLPSPIHLPAQAAPLRDLLAAHARQTTMAAPDTPAEAATPSATVLPFTPRTPQVVMPGAPRVRRYVHVLDRLAVAA